MQTVVPSPGLNAQEEACGATISRSHPSAECSLLHFLTLFVSSGAGCPGGYEVGLHVGLVCIALVTDASEYLCLG